MKITEEEKRKIEKFTQRNKRKKYLYEGKNQREIRKYREKYEKYNMGDGCEMCSFGNAYNDAPQRYVKNEKGEWETENIIFKYHNKHKWEDHDRKHTKQKQKEVCILYENGVIIVVNAIIEKHHTELYDKYEPDKKNDRIFMTLPEYKMNFEVEKMRDFDKLPDKIKMSDEEYDKEELLKAILVKAVNIYEVK